MSRIKLPPNPYSQYGRQRMRREFWHRYHNTSTPRQRTAGNRAGGLFMALLLLAIAALVWIKGR